MTTPPWGFAGSDLRARLEPVLAAAGQREARQIRHRLQRYDELGAISYPDLPVSARRDDLMRAVAENQVVVVAGETGSGKTTQLPKICLELGRGVAGLIGQTHPPRLAARSVAERLAEELGSTLGEVVGYTVRFTDQVGESTLVRLMTDGILLAEIQRDPMLARYDTLIIDEAHERSLTIDFLLGYLKRLLPRRPDLKVIITSATIDPEAFARHFGPTPEQPAPIVEVSGRTYPVEVRYRPLDAEEPRPGDDEPGGAAARAEPRDQIQGILEAIAELSTEPTRGGPADVLVFLSGEREIRDTADALADAVRAGAVLPGTEVVPLYGRLSAAEQHKVFAVHAARRIILATNVAETSLTVPGIRYVVDTGTARISRYSQRTKVQRLPIEPVSQASANQRAGRCGRLADGVCIRLYSQQDYESRPEFTEPEILRTSLAAVILQMTSLGLGEVADFPFLDPPDSRQVKDGVTLLHELDALETGSGPRRLTHVGRTLARLPVDPRLARMLVEAHRAQVLREVVPIVAGLAIMDPRERPTDAQAQADQSHARFADPGSDFIAYLNLWNYLGERQRELSSSAFRRLCRSEYLHYLRVREWQDLHAQLSTVLRRARMAVPAGPIPEKPDHDAIHLSLLSGLLSQIGLLDERTAGPAPRGRRPPIREYQGARGARFAIAPGSSLFRAGAPWVMVAELVETSRLWGRTAARIDPLWVERLAGHLVRRSHSEPRWERRRAAAVATEKVTLYGVPVVAARTVSYARVDPDLSRELFIRHALVEGDWRTDHRFFHENRRLLEDVEGLEDRVRRRDILVDDEALFDFYDRRIPADVVSGAHFDSWWKNARRDRPDLLSFWTSMLLTPAAEGVDAQEHPTSWRFGDLDLPLTYQFSPGDAADGVTVHVPLAVLNQVSGDAFEWQIPGLREELVTELIRSLPKSIRREFAPAPDHARRVLQRLGEPEGPLLPALSRELEALPGGVVPGEAWDVARVPAHLRVTFRVEDGGRPVGEGEDLDALREELRPRLREAISDAVAGVERDGLTTWPPDLPDLPRQLQRHRGGLAVQGFPALVDRGRAVAVRVLDGRAEQQRSMRVGTRRLVLLQVPSPAKGVLAGLGSQQKLALASAPHAGAADLFADCLAATVAALVDEHGGPAWNAGDFGRLLGAVRADLPGRAGQVVAAVARVLDGAREVDARLRSSSSPALLASLADARAQLSGLVHPGFVTATGAQKLPDLERYLAALLHRLERLPERPQRDQTLLHTVHSAQQAYADALARLPRARREDEDVTSVRWMIEELRVSLFGGGLRTAYPISPQRIIRALAAL